MSFADKQSRRVVVDGKFFCVAGEKMPIKGVAYGPFAPDKEGGHFPSLERTVSDFELIRLLGVNVLRVYYAPPGWFLDLAAESGLRLLVDIPWGKHLCFLDSERTKEEARAAVRKAAEGCASHPAVFALSVVNEIPPDIVRWNGAKRTAEFVDELIEIVKGVDPRCLCTFGNFPPTEFLRPRNIDFHCFNVYLHQPRPFENYLSRLQMIADAKPLLLGEFGVDSAREGEERKCQMLAWQMEAAYRGGLAGVIVYSFTDDWHVGGVQIQDWAFGLTTAERAPKPSFGVAQQMFRAAPYFPLDRYPLVSVVVASFNGARTLQACLESLGSLNYPEYEVILVDDGSEDDTEAICGLFPSVRYIRHVCNQGLSIARNTGIKASRGEIVAFTDSDCRADRDWLHYLVGDLLNSKFAGIGGHNLLPPDDSTVAAAVMVSPGGPAHVMLTDRLAEHIPGCNMAFYKWALLEVGCFDPLFRKAGDDVDICWRLQQRGYKLGFSPAGFVWHYRRSTVMDYLRQQRGYGEAEALLVHRHPEYFNWFGSSQWQGRIYSAAKFGLVARRPMIYHGTFGSGFFQTLYTSPPARALMMAASLEYHVLVTFPLLVLGLIFDLFLPFGIASVAMSLGVCAGAAAQAEIPKSKVCYWSRPLVGLLFFLQPIVRGWGRYQGGLNVPRTPLLSKRTEMKSLGHGEGKGGAGRHEQLDYWNDRGIDRIEFLGAVMKRLDLRNWPNKADAGWNDFDLEIYGNRWGKLQLVTAAEMLGGNRKVLKCRLRTSWTLFSRALICVLAVGELLLLGFLGHAFPVLWLTLLLLPTLVWRIQVELGEMQRMAAAFLDEIAEELKLVKLGSSAGLGLGAEARESAAAR